MNRRITAIIGVFVVGASLAYVTMAQAGSRAAPVIRGAGTTMLEGGTGEPSFTPVITKLAFHWEHGSGDFECLALAPSEPAGDPGSGEFGTNVMYVTGPITSASMQGSVAVLKGTATVTGLGAGTDKPFTLRARQGGPGTPVVLEVSGLTFKEIMLEGHITL
ncbi:MAG: hypothetical protein ABR529_14690 [Actinomycetota bacterium]